MKNVNLTTKESTLDYDVTNSLIDTMLEQSTSIMFIRQATYYFIMKLNGYDSKLMQKEVKHRAKLAGVDINAGVLSREVRVADYAILNCSKLFNTIKLDKKDLNNTIKKIAQVMVDNNIKYNSLKDQLTTKKPESIPQESAEATAEATAGATAEAREQKIDFEAVVNFIDKIATHEELLNLCDVLTAKLTNGEVTAEEKAI